MPVRQPVEIRDAELSDAPALIELWSTCAADQAEDGTDPSAQRGLWREPSIPEAEEALAFNQGHHGRRLLVAVVGEEIVGVAAADLTTLTPISMSKVMLVTDLQVRPSHRRRSIASNLLAVIAIHAEDLGCDLVVTSVQVQAKEPNRFMTKLGFNQVAVLRAAPVGKLNARLAAKSAGSRETGRLLAVRRSLRRRHAIHQ
ncbi:MAG TPA: GNAT family N-acetyltransferase [Aeromicrobium sp.]|nr:GNAT family N-acetyltransferase [Aeromicrobium sp.]